MWSATPRPPCLPKRLVPGSSRFAFIFPLLYQTSRKLTDVIRVMSLSDPSLGSCNRRSAIGKRGRNERFRPAALRIFKISRGFKVSSDSSQDRETCPNREACRHSPARPAAVPSKWETSHDGACLALYESACCSRLKKQKNDLSPIISLP